MADECKRCGHEEGAHPGYGQPCEDCTVGDPCSQFAAGRWLAKYDVLKLAQGLADIKAGRTTPWPEVRDALNRAEDSKEEGN